MMIIELGLHKIRINTYLKQPEQTLIIIITIRLIITISLFTEFIRDRNDYMSTSLGSTPTENNTNTLNESLTLSPSEQKKRAALDLAELIYEVFVANKANASMEQKG